jgi:glycogen operon protein
VARGTDRRHRDPGARRLSAPQSTGVALLAQGVPLILAGDEVGNSQGGNNNAYCHDDEIGW